MELGCVVRSPIERQEHQKSRDEAPVSDNRTAFTSEVFTAFIHRNGIQDMTSAPCTSNGSPEQAVETAKGKGGVMVT